MKPVIRLGIGFAACLFLAVGAYFLATGMIDSLYAFRSPIKDKAPAPGEAFGRPVTRRMVLVLIDALRYDTSYNTAVMPTLARLRQQGAYTRMHSKTPSYSEPGYSTLITGGWPYLNDGPAMNLDYVDIPTWTQDNLFSAAKRTGMKTAISGYYWFEKLVPQDAVSTHFYTPGEDEKADRDVVDAVLPWLTDPASYQLVLIHIDQVDYAGHHQGGPRDPRWNAAAARADGLVSEILSKLDLSKDTIAVFSDHGQIDRGGHGGYEPVALTEPLVLAGAGIRPGPYEDVQMVDLAPTISALLGLNLPASGQGRVREKLLALPAESAAKIPTMEAAQQEQLVKIYTTAIGQPVTQPRVPTVDGWQAAIESARNGRLANEQWPRALISLVILAVTAWAVLQLAGARIGWALAGLGVYLLVYNLRYVVIDQFTYSFSSIPGSMDLIIYNAITVVIAMVAAWLTFGLGARLFRSRPMDAAVNSLSLTFTIAWALVLVALVNFTINGFTITWTTPEPVSFFFGLFALVQLLFTGAYGLLFSGLSALIARVTHARA